MGKNCRVLRRIRHCTEMTSVKKLLLWLKIRRGICCMWVPMQAWSPLILSKDSLRKIRKNWNSWGKRRRRNFTRLNLVVRVLMTTNPDSAVTKMSRAICVQRRDLWMFPSFCQIKSLMFHRMMGGPWKVAPFLIKSGSDVTTNFRIIRLVLILWRRIM